MIRFDSTDGNCQGFARKRSIAINPVTQLPHKTLFHEMAHVTIATPWNPTSRTWKRHRGTCAKSKRKRLPYSVARRLDWKERNSHAATFRTGCIKASATTRPPFPKRVRRRSFMLRIKSSEWDIHNQVNEVFQGTSRTELAVAFRASECSPEL